MGVVAVEPPHGEVKWARVPPDHRTRARPHRACGLVPTPAALSSSLDVAESARVGRQGGGVDYDLASRTT